MAQTLTLSDGTTTVNLLTGYAKLAVEGWSEQSVSGKIWSTFNLVAPATATDANIRTVKIQIDKLIEDARRYRDESTRSKEVWLTWASEGEASKKAVVTDGESEILTGEFDSPLLGTAFFSMTLTLEHDVWVDNAVNTQSNVASMTALGYKWTPTTGNESSEDGHISLLKVSSTEDVVTIDDVWIGIRSLNEGTGDFDPFYEAEDGTGNGSDCIEVAGTASGGAYMACDFSNTESMAVRMSINLSDNSTTKTHLVGKYLVLARVLTGGSTAVAVQMRFGFSYDATKSPAGSIVTTTYLNNLTGWTLVELGYINIPSGANKYYDATGVNLNNEYLQIYAERLSGAGVLWIDCFTLIPAEHTFSCQGANIGAANIGGPLYIVTGPDGSQYAKGTTSQGYFFDVQGSFNDWVYPAEGGVLVIAGQNFSGSFDLTATFSRLDLSVYPRWKSYRSDEPA